MKTKLETILVAVIFTVVCLGVHSSYSATVYVTNYLSNSISVIDTDTKSVTDTIYLPSPGGPLGIDIAPLAELAYVANYSGNYVTVLDLITKQAVDFITVGSYPAGVAVLPDESFVYVSNYISDSVSVIDTQTNTVVSTIPVVDGPIAEVALSKNGKTLLVPNLGTTASFLNIVSVIDTENNYSPFNIVLDAGAGAYGTAISSNRKTAYAANFLLNKVSVIDMATGAVIDDVPVGIAPRGIALSPGGKTLVVGNSDVYGGGWNSSVTIVDTKTLATTEVPISGRGPRQVAILGKYAYVTNQLSNDVSVIDIKLGEESAVIPVGAAPMGIAVMRD